MSNHQYVIIIITIILILFNYSKNINENIKKNRLNIIIVKLIKQCSRWAVASENDMAPVIKVLHANYATGYLWALIDIASSEEIKNATGIDILVFTKKITDIQEKATKYMIMSCPQYEGNIDKYLSSISGE